MKSQNKIANLIIWLYILFFFFQAIYILFHPHKESSLTQSLSRQSSTVSLWSTPRPKTSQKSTFHFPSLSTKIKPPPCSLFSHSRKNQIKFCLLSQLINQKNRTLRSSSSVSPSDLDLQVLFYLIFQSLPQNSTGFSDFDTAKESMPLQVWFSLFSIRFSGEISRVDFEHVGFLSVWISQSSFQF